MREREVSYIELRDQETSSRSSTSVTNLTQVTTQGEVEDELLR
jgi:hypothetical protein